MPGGVGGGIQPAESVPEGDRLSCWVVIRLRYLQAHFGSLEGGGAGSAQVPEGRTAVGAASFGSALLAGAEVVQESDPSVGIDEVGGFQLCQDRAEQFSGCRRAAVQALELLCFLIIFLRGGGFPPRLLCE